MGDRPLLLFVPTPELLRRQRLRGDEIEGRPRSKSRAKSGSETWVDSSFATSST